MSLLRKWQEERSDLRCILCPSNTEPTSVLWLVHGKCWVHEVSNKLVVGFSEEAALRVHVSAISRFEFDTPFDVKSLSSELLQYGSWLTIHVPTNLILMLAEKKDVIDHTLN